MEFQDSRNPRIMMVFYLRQMSLLLIISLRMQNQRDFFSIWINSKLEPRKNLLTMSQARMTSTICLRKWMNVSMSLLIKSVVLWTYTERISLIDLRVKCTIYIRISENFKNLQMRTLIRWNLKKKYLIVNLKEIGLKMNVIKSILSAMKNKKNSTVSKINIVNVFKKRNF